MAIEILKQAQGYELITDGGRYAVVSYEGGRYVSVAHNADGSRNTGSRAYAAIWQSQAEAEALYSETINAIEELNKI